MFTNRTTLILCAICYGLLVFGGLFGFLSHFITITIIGLTALLVLINLIMKPKIKQDDDKFI